MIIENGGLPPNFEKINNAFHVAGQAVLFCYGDIICNPYGVEIPPQLIKHEEVHSRQQGSDVEGWWDKYIEDPEFRWEQELEAHVVEWKEYCKRHGGDKRIAYLKIVAERLSSPIYGQMRTYEQCRDAILTYKRKNGVMEHELA